MTFQAPNLHDALGQFGYWDDVSMGLPTNAIQSPYSMAMPAFTSAQDFSYNSHMQSLCQSSPSLPLSMPLESLSSMDMPYNSMEGIQQPSFPSYSSVPATADPAVLQALQAHLASAGLLPQPQLSHMGSSNNASLDLLQNMSPNLQSPYVDAQSNFQSNFQAVLQALLHQKLTAAQLTAAQLSFLQNLALKQQELQNATSTIKAKKGSNRNASVKQRGQSRSNKKSAPVTGQAPSWADSNWHPLAAVLSKGSKGPKESAGTGVFLPGGASQDAGAAKAKMVGSPKGQQLHAPMHQECRC